MLAGLANFRQPGKPRKFAVFRQMQFSFRFMFMLGLLNIGCLNQERLSSVFSFGRSSQLSAAESPSSDCLFVIDLFMSFNNEILNDNRTYQQPAAVNCPVRHLHCLSKSSSWRHSFPIYNGAKMYLRRLLFRLWILFSTYTSLTWRVLLNG